jgi:nitrate reductase (NAD(P)H)
MTFRSRPRYVALYDVLLPPNRVCVFRTTEKSIKNQEWPGKAEQEREAEQKKKEKEKEKEKGEGDENKGDGKDGGKKEDDKKEGQDDEKEKNKDQDPKKQDGQETGDKKKNAEEPKSETKPEDADQKSAPGDDDKSNDQENGDPDMFDNLSEGEKKWFKKFIEEMDFFENLKNDPGVASTAFGKHGLKALQEDFKPENEDLDGKDRVDVVEAARQERKLRFTEQAAMRVQLDDQFTPDSWIPRSDHLLRLTGKHPMNAEANMTELFDAGLITPTKLHYIRNHGAVPRLAWETHTLEIFSDPPGLIDPTELSMDDIVQQFTPIEIPVTLACDGNRRKEVNMIKQSGGFGWSAAGVSTCMWTGALLRDILLKQNLKERPGDERWYLNYEGADEPSEGKYATSIPLSYVMDETNDVMLAYGINGAPLQPDHGYPLRSIIPSFVGGRCVKWLKKVWISKKPNQSH